MSDVMTVIIMNDDCKMSNDIISHVYKKRSVTLCVVFDFMTKLIAVITTLTITIIAQYQAISKSSKAQCDK